MKMLETIVLGGCFHFPHADPKAVNVFLNTVKQTKPSKIVLLGDLVDASIVSKYPRDPNKVVTLQWEIDETRKFLKQLRKLAPLASIEYLEGNHEIRLQKYLASKAPELASLRCMTMPQLLDLDGFNISWLPYGEYSVLYPGLITTHGTVVRGKSGQSALGELQKAGMSGVSAHTHRQALVHQTNYSKQTFWVEAGCLCTPNQEYILGTPDWQQGFAVITIQDGCVWPELVPIQQGVGFFRGCRIHG